MGIDCDESIDETRQQGCEISRAQTLTGVEPFVLTHVRQVRRNQPYALCALVAQGAGGKIERQQLAVRPIQRARDNRIMSSHVALDAHQGFAVWELPYSESAFLNSTYGAQRRCQRLISRRRKDESAHRSVSTTTASSCAAT
jgi:hypothetical protein